MYNLDIFSVNTTHSIISGGGTSDLQDVKSTWFYNHVTKTFHQGPESLMMRTEHNSGCLKYGNQEVPIVVGGFTREYFPSTEILLNGRWIEGTMTKNTRIFVKEIF